MNKQKIILKAGISLLAGVCSAANAIHFDKPATANGEEEVWVATDEIWQNYSLPVGNGSMGITTYGGVEQEVLYLTTDTVWTGKYQPNADNEDAHYGLTEIRRLLMEDKYDEAEALSRKHLGATGENKAAFGSFSVIGRILIDTDLKFSDVSNYERALNLDDAIATVSYQHEETRYDREVFASYPDQAAVLRYGVCGEANQNLRISFETPHNTEAHEAFEVSVENNDLVIIGHFAESGLQIDTRIRVRASRGKIVAGPDYLEIKNAGTVEIFVAADTSYDRTVENLVGEPKTAEVLARLDRAVEQSYGTLRARHIADYRELYNRVTLDLGATNKTIRTLPMNERLERYAAGANDPELEAKVFQFGRYLMIASSRPGSLPANLQGVWSNSPTAPWEGDYHLDINLQMNYWLTGVTNLIECQEPLIDFLELLQRNGNHTAHAYYRADGWTATLLSNAWGYTSPNFTLDELENRAWNPRRNRFIRTPMYWNYFPSVGPWIAHHAYEHFAYNQDRGQLEAQLWPILSGSADFVCDFLFQLPSGHYTDLPSWSPEHGRISKGATASIAISREVLQASLELAGVLGIENEQTQRYQEVLDNLLPYRIGQHGQLQEWYEDRDRVDDQHRHVNHLIGLHPGSQISPLTTPDLAEATRVTLSHRGAMSTGWSLAWKMNLMARLLDEKEAYNMLRLFLEARVGANLYCMHPPFQIDGNFGVTAAIGEMLLQSHLGEIHLLPALAEGWPSGQVKGLRARGGFEVDIAWSDHQLVEGAIRAITAGICRIRVVGPVRVERDGEAIDVERSEDGVLSFPAEKGQEYTLVALP